MKSPASWPDSRSASYCGTWCTFPLTLGLIRRQKSSWAEKIGRMGTVSASRKDADIIVVYYAGHGIEVDGINYVIPVDARLASTRDAPDEAITLDRVLEAAEGARQLGLIILDACRDNPFARMKPSRTAAPRPAPAVKSGMMLVEPVRPNTLIYYAAKKCSGTDDGASEHSPFTSALLKHLFTPGQDIRFAFGKTRDGVMKETGNRQEPYVTGTFGGTLVSFNPAPAPAAAEARARDLEKVETEHYLLVKEVGSIKAWKVFLLQHPNGLYAGLAREELEKLEKASAPGVPSTAVPIGKEGTKIATLERRSAEIAAKLDRQPPRRLRPVRVAGPNMGVRADPEDAELVRLRAELETWKRKREMLAKIEEAQQQDAKREAVEHAEQERLAKAEEEARLKAEREAALKRIPFKGRDSEPLADLPPPPPATVERFPTIEAARRVAPGAQIAVVVSLTVDKVTPQVTVHATGPSASTSPHGALQIPMPADGSRVVLKVVLHAAGFDFDPGSRNEATITLDRSGDSTSAVFRITARPDAVGEHALRVTFWRDNEFLACASRRIEIIDLPQVASAKPEDLKAVRASEDAQLSFSLRPRPIDLKVEVLYDNADGLGHGRVTIASDYLGNLRHGDTNTSPAIVDWLQGFYRDFKEASARAQLAGDTDEAREARLARLRAFGEELYRRAAPPALQTALSELLANPAVKLRTVQIYSNNPLIPWELMRAPRPEGGSTDFFGIAFALARWHEEDGPRPALRPPQDAEVHEVIAIAPTYSVLPALAAQTREIDEIASVLSARRVAGKRADFLALVRNPPSGIIHFAGHGEIAGRTAADRRFTIELEDGPFDVMDWRGVPVARAHGRALFFFNACDVGQAESVAGAVEGWAPAVLARGAAGYIGGLWPLTDDPAARFAVAFYRALSQRLKEQGRASVAEALSDARRLVYQTADPTYLGYAFYGDAQLALVRN
jgi:hypothetical protein